MICLWEVTLLKVYWDLGFFRLSLSLSLSHCFDEVTQFNPTSESDEEVLANIARLSSVAMCWVNIFFNSKFLVLLFDLIQGNL